MKKEITTILLFCIYVLTATAQTECATEDASNIYWQPHHNINFSDFQSDDKDDCIKFNEKFGLKMSSNIALRGIVDIPKKKNSGKYDKLYLAPVFCRGCSCKLDEDSLDLKVSQLLFDLAELSARQIRKELFNLQEQINVDNINSMFYTTSKNKWEKIMHGSWATIFREIYIEKKDRSYESWRQMVDELMEQDKDFQTTAEECYRFVMNEPLKRDYKMAKSITDDLKE